MSNTSIGRSLVLTSATIIDNVGVFIFELVLDFVGTHMRCVKVIIDPLMV